MHSDLRRLLDVAALTVREASWVGLRRRKSFETFYSAKNCKLDTAGTNSTDGVMVEVLYNGCFGYCASSDLSSQSVASAALKALTNAKAMCGREIYYFDENVRQANIVSFESKRQNKSSPTPKYIFDSLFEICNSLKVSEKIVETKANVETYRYDTEIVSTNGAEIDQSLHIIGVSMQATAKDNDIIQFRTANSPRGLTRQGSWEFFNPHDLCEDAKIIGAEAIELLDSPNCPNDRRTLVLAPNQLMLQIHESCGHALELDRILGDERNFAGGSFIKLSDFGSFQYGSELMNITFDPSVEGELACYGADEIGNIARKEYLIKDGILVRGLGSLESQARSGISGVANQRAESWNRPPIDRMGNINLEPGTSSFDEIISGIEKGILMQTNRSWSIDDYRNKFQFGCEYGTLIENGKLTQTVRNPNYRGISSSFWRNLYAVGDKSTFKYFGTPNCGKGEPNQMIFVGHASPVCAFKDVEVFGGEE